jgi:hypothetical protein
MAHPAAALKTMEGIFIVISWFLDGLVSAVFLEIFQNLPGLGSGQIRPHPHVHHKRFPLGGCPLGGIPFRMTTVAVDLV